MIQTTTRLFRAAALATLLCGVSTVPLLAQEPAGAPADSAAHHRHGPPSNGLFAALDTNHDGVISADEMANASTSLKTPAQEWSDRDQARRPAACPSCLHGKRGHDH